MKLPGRGFGVKKRKIGRYEIKGELGHGGMSTIVHAYDPRFRRDVAIKMLPWEFMHTSIRERFQREAMAIALLEHPAIVPVYDIGEERGRPYIVMRYMSGGSLSDRLRYGAIPVPEAVAMITRLAQALDAAHARGIVHRDVKPDNVLFDHYGTVFLSDFGLARLKETGGFANISDGNILGTPAYMSPEQIQGKELDGRSDVYSLGVVFYHMITGIPPYSGNSVPSILMMHLINPVPKLLDTDLNLPPAFDQIIQTAMAKEQIFRYSTAGEMAAAIEAAAKDYISTAPTRPAPPVKEMASAGQAQKTTLVLAPTEDVQGVPSVGKPETGIRLPPVVSWLRQVPVWSWSAAVLVLLSLLSVGLLTSLSRPQSPARSEVPSPVIIGGADKLAVLYAGEIWISNLDGTETQQLTQDGEVKSGLQWASDGRRVLYHTKACIKSVDILAAEDDPHRTKEIICLKEIQSLDGFSVSPDGENLAMIIDQWDLYLLPYQEAYLREADTPKALAQLATCAAFAPYRQNAALSSVEWSASGWQMALQYADVGQSVPRDSLRVVDFSKCIPNPPIVDEISTLYLQFTLGGYYRQPKIGSFAWDGNRFILNSSSSDGGWGELQIYDVELGNTQVVAPMGNSCCYRDARWSPDGDYLIAAYQPETGEGTQLVYAPVAEISQDASFQPTPLPVIFLNDATGAPQLALRAARLEK